MAKLDYAPYVIDRNGYLDISVSTSSRGAVSRVLASELGENAPKSSVSKIVGSAMTSLDGEYGDAGNIAFRVEEEIFCRDWDFSNRCWKPSRRLYSFMRDFGEIQVADMAQEISSKRGKNPADCLELARTYIEFYNRNRLERKNK